MNDSIILLTLFDQSSVAVKRLFDHVVPNGTTPMAEKLEELLLAYMSALERAKDLADAGDMMAMKAIKPVNYIVITDGSPSRFGFLAQSEFGNILLT
jgi:hypothetical protein